MVDAVCALPVLPVVERAPNGIDLLLLRGGFGVPVRFVHSGILIYVLEPNNLTMRLQMKRLN